MYDIVSFDIPKVGKSHIKPYCYISSIGKQYLNLLLVSMNLLHLHLYNRCSDSSVGIVIVVLQRKKFALFYFSLFHFYISYMLLVR
jgi:hypothetical protein